MSNEQEIIQERIRKNQQMIKSLNADSKFLEEKALSLDQIEQEKITDLEKLLKQLGKLGIDYPLFLDFQEDNLLKISEKDYLLVFVPLYESELLRSIGNVGKYIAKMSNYVCFHFDASTDPRWEFPEEIASDVEQYLATGFEMDLSIADGVLLFKPEVKDQVKAKYNKYLSSIQEQSATIKPKLFLDFLEDLGKQGYFIFDSGPYPKEFLRKLDYSSKIIMTDAVKIKTEKGIEIRDYTYQKEIVNQLPKHKHATLGIKTGSGKTIVSLALIELLIGKKLVLVDNDLARTQWRDDIKKWTPKIAHEIHVDTYQALSNALELKKNALWKFIKDEHLSLIVYDEGDRAFNYEWGKSLALKSEGRLFLTATPFPRNVSDQISRRNLFGRMFATDWQRTMKAQKKDFATGRVNILQNEKEKLSRLIDRVIKFRKNKQMIHCQWKEKEGVLTGHDLARRLSRALGHKVEFIHGQIKGNRLEKLKQALTRDSVVVTTLASRSVSIKELSNTHIFNPLKSETSGPQQTGRLGHSDRKDKHFDIYFTKNEITKEKAQEWIYFLIGKGYTIEFPDGRPKFEKKATILEQTTKSIIEKERKEKPLQVKTSKPITKTQPGDIDGYFQNPIVRERIEEMKQQPKLPRKGKTLQILGFLAIYPELTKDEVFEKTKTKLNSASSVSEAIANLVHWGFIVKDTSKEPFVIRLDFDSLTKFVQEKREKVLLAQKMKDFGLTS
ncbi:MAG: DEAD/DEAH box helicase family protein [Candidatus Heimdallarchaeota archaeon]|nr:DEAD/DEAH box helicase family protein [Candidatus Heimdallarchaeota archaeon]